MNYISLCDGIGAAHVAWQPLGWQCLGVSEINPFCNRVIEHHWGFENLGRMDDHETIETIAEKKADLIIGGTTCQDFSVAGKREGIEGDNGQLLLWFLFAVYRARPKYVVWENVPGVLSQDKGAVFRAFIASLAECGYLVEWRVLDAQYFGVPQRRRRVFVVGRFGGSCRGTVLFESEGVPRFFEEIEKDQVPDVDWWSGKGRILNCIDASYGKKWGSNQWYARGHVIIDATKRARRASIREVERCFGFPDDYTNIPTNGKKTDYIARYTALGNSMCVPVIRWIGQQILKSESEE